jgi:hypothetical protein
MVLSENTHRIVNVRPFYFPNAKLNGKHFNNLITKADSAIANLLSIFLLQFFKSYESPFRIIDLS